MPEVSMAAPNEGRGAGLQRDVAERLTAHLRDGGWAVEYLAVALGVAPRTVERWCRGDAPPPAYIWLALDELEHREQPRAPAAAPNFAARMAAGSWSVSALAVALGIPASTVRKWRQGRVSAPPAHVYLAIAAAERRRPLAEDAQPPDGRAGV